MSEIIAKSFYDQGDFDDRYIYYCPRRDKLYLIDSYTHSLDDSKKVSVDRINEHQVLFTQWVYIGEL